MSVSFFTAGWSYDDWVGSFYPKRQSQTFNYLEYQSQFLDGTEVNSSFYAVPRRDYVEKWLNRTPADYLFTFKILQTMTHGYPHEAEPHEVRGLIKAIEPAAKENRLAGLLMQFPPFFTAKEQNMARIDWIRDRLGDFPLIVETRHHSWETDEMIHWLHERNLAVCSQDMPGRDGIPIETLHCTSKQVSYIRFHGRRHDVFYQKVPKNLSAEERDEAVVEKYNYLYSKEELTPWVERIRKLARHSQNVIVVANNHFRGKAPANALMLKSMLEQRRVPIPKPLLAEYPHLAEFADEDAPDA